MNKQVLEAEDGWKTLDDDFTYKSIKAGLVKLLLQDRRWDLSEMSDPVEEIETYLKRFLSFDFKVLDAGVYFDEIINLQFHRFTICIIGKGFERSSTFVDLVLQTNKI